MDTVVYLITYMCRLNNYLEEKCFRKFSCDNEMIRRAVTDKGVDAVIKTGLDFTCPGRPGIVLADGDSAVVLTNVRGYEIFVAENGLFAQHPSTGHVVTPDHQEYTPKSGWQTNFASLKMYG